MTELIKLTDEKSGLPIFKLGIIGAALFLSILTEALPAGFLHSLQLAFSVSPSEAGQWVTLYAVGSLLSAIPLTLATQHWSRKNLLLFCNTQKMIYLFIKYQSILIKHFPFFAQFCTMIVAFKKR